LKLYFVHAVGLLGVFILEYKGIFGKSQPDNPVANVVKKIRATVVKAHPQQSRIGFFVHRDIQMNGARALSVSGPGAVQVSSR
jgi:hypothetical protein